MTTEPGDLVFDPTCVREGTLVWRVEGSPPLVPPQAGGGTDSLPVNGEGWGGATLVPVETIRPADYVLGHDGLLHHVLRTIRRPYRGTMIGIRHERSNQTLWLTADHRVLAKTRPRSLSGHNDWSGIPDRLRGRSKELRREMTPPERKLWSALRKDQTGFTFRRQHPIGPYIADFYSRRARLVVEVDGAAAHGTAEAIAHDQIRDSFLRSLGLRVLRVPARDVEHNLVGIAAMIQMVCEEQVGLAGAEWVEAGNLMVGDIVFSGTDLLGCPTPALPVNGEGTPITSVETALTEEKVYDLEVTSAHSFLTEVCAVHNCGSGTTANVAEHWGRRWITVDTSRVALERELARG